MKLTTPAKLGVVEPPIQSPSSSRQKYKVRKLRLLYDTRTAFWGTTIPIIFTPSPLVNYADQKQTAHWIKWPLITLLSVFIGLVYPNGADSSELTRLNHQFAPVHFPEAAPLKPANNWTYSIGRNEPSTPVRWAEVASTNTLDFDFPYNSGLMGYFTIVRKQKGVGMILRLEKGLFQAKSIVGNYVRIRLDQGAEQSLRIHQTSVNEPNVVYLKAKPGFVAALKGAKAMQIEIQFYNERVKQLDFAVAGLARNF